MMQTGVYEILNVVNGKRYIGSTAKSIRIRWNQHRSDLRNGRHKNEHLQNAWKKYGEKSFIFSVLIRCAPNDCLKREQMFIDKFRSSKKSCGYNITPTAGSTLGTRQTEEHKEKISKALKGRPTSVIHRAHLSSSLKGRKPTKEARENMSAAAKKRCRSREGKSHIKFLHSDAIQRKRSASMTGQKRTAESKSRMSRARKRFLNSLTPLQIRKIIAPALEAQRNQRIAA